MGYFQAILSFVVWGAVSPLLVRFIPLPAPIITFTGSIIGLSVMTMWVGARGLRDVADAFRTHGWRLVVFGWFFIGCSMTFHWSIKTTTLANAEITHALQALITCLVFMPLFGMGRVRRSDFVAVMLGLGGLAIAMPPHLEWQGHALGIGMGLLSAVFYAAMNVQASQFASRMRPEILLTCNFATVAMTAPFAACFYIAAVGPIAPTGDFGFGAAAALVALGVMNFIVANLLFIRALKTIPVSHVAILGYTEPVIGIAAGVLVFGEALTIGVVAGGALVLISSAMVMRD